MRKTKAALTRALFELVIEKGYRRTTVKELLDRADVGRSTFYSHYRGKDDLLLRSFSRMLAQIDRCLDRDGGETDRVVPVRELFHHVGKARDFHRALERARKIDWLFREGTRQLSRSIAGRLATASDIAGDPVPLDVRSRMAAGAVFTLLAWWLEGETRHTPEELDDAFHALILGPGPGSG